MFRSIVVPALVALGILVVLLLTIPAPDPESPGSPPGPEAPPEPREPRPDPMEAKPGESSAGAVTGRVVSREGAAVPGAKVRLDALPWEHSGKRQAVSDGVGRFEFLDVPPGGWSLFAHARGRGAGLVPFLSAVEGMRVEVEVRLDRESASVSGVVLDQLERPVSGATVALRLPHPLFDAMKDVGAVAIDPLHQEFHTLDLSTTTDGEGRFHLDCAPPGRNVLAAWEDRRGILWGMPVTAPADDLVLRLRGTGSVRGVVRIDGGPRPGEVSIRLVPGGRAASVSVDGEEAGFSLTLLTPGRYVARVDAEAFRSAASVPFEVEAGVEADVGTIVLMPGTVLRGRVSDPNGHSIVGAELALARVIETGLSSGLSYRDNIPADTEGRFEIRLNPGRWRLEPGCRGYAPAAGAVAGVEVTLGEEPVSRDFVLAPLAALHGLVVDSDGEPVEGVLVLTPGPTAGAPETPRFRRLPGFEEGEDPVRDWTGPDGRFRLCRLLEGEEYDIIVLDGAKTIGEAGPVVFDEEGRSREIRIFVAREGDRPKATASATGRVLDADDRPVPGAVVVVGSGVGMSGPDGRFEIEGIDGAGLLKIAAPGFATKVGHEFAVDAGDRDFGDIVISRESRIAVSGRVTNQEGAPVEDAWVNVTFILPDGQAIARTSYTDDDGRYRVAGPDLAAVRATVSVGVSNLQRGSKTVVCEPEALVDFTVEVRTAVTGKVTFSGETPDAIDVNGRAIDGEGSYGPWVEFNAATGTWKANFRAGSWRFLIAAAGYASVQTEPVEVPAGKTTEVPAAHLTPGGTVEGVLRDGDGEPVPDANVVVEFHGRGRPGRTDAEGNFRIEHLPPGRWVVRGWLKKPHRVPSREVSVVEGETTWVEIRSDR